MLHVMKRWQRRLGPIPFSLLMVSLLMLVCGYPIYNIWFAARPFGARTMNLAGRQRMLLQQIAKETLILVQEPSAEQRIRSRQRTFGITAEFRRIQQGLERGDQILKLTGDNTDATRTVLAHMVPNIKQLDSNVETIYRSRLQQLLRLSIDSPEVQGILGAVELLVVDYDDLMRGYIAGAEQDVVRHQAIEIIVFIAAFLLILQAQLVARALGSQIQRFSARLRGKHWLLRQEIIARRRSEEGHRLLVAAFEQADESIVITDTSGKVRYINAAFIRNTGYSGEEILGKTQSMLKSGKQDSSFYRQMWSTISSGQPWRGQMVNRRRDGTLRIETQAIFPIRDRRGQVTHFAGIKHDITREVEMEKQLRESQRLEAIGVLASGVAHDFNNILTPIIGYTDLTMELVPDASEAHDNLAIVRTAANRAKDIVTQIRNVVRENTNPTQAIHLPAITKEVLTLVRSTASKSIAIAEKIPQDLPSVQGDPSTVHRLLMNLCVNACQAMPEGGQLSITLGAVQLQATTGFLGNPAPGDFVRIEVKDTGHGMSEETKAHIFEPYFTTRLGGTGTGLGLFLVFNIVRQLKGGIRVASYENAGTSFEIILPVPQSHSASEYEPGRLEMRGQERILFIDDEEMIARLAKSALERLGYHVTAMSEPIAACALVEEDPVRFDVVFTDRSMPGMTGDDVFKRIKAIRPSIPVILCTGLYDEHAEKNDIAMGFDACLLKPFAPGELSATIRKVMGDGSGLRAGGVKESTRPA